MYDNIIKEAHEAGMIAGNNFTPVPMMVGSAKSILSNEIDHSKPTYYVSEGVCGFAQISFKGNTAFAKYVKKIGIARKDYPTGLYIPVREFGQSMQRKEAYAKAYASVLKKYGIDCYATSRLD